MKRYPLHREIELKLIAGLREKGYKLTPQRLAIIKVLSNDRSHPGAMDILNKLKKSAPKISMSTVYYTLEILKKEGLIQELEFYDGDNRYDVNVSSHINLICRKCGKIMDYGEQIPISAERVKRKTGFVVDRIRFEYYGYCKNCRRSRVKKFK